MKKFFLRSGEYLWAVGLIAIGACAIIFSSLFFRTSHKHRPAWVGDLPGGTAYADAPSCASCESCSSCEPGCGYD